MKRIYEVMLSDNFEKNRQMAFISGPRQVGKTTLVHQALPKGKYLNYDIPADSKLIRSGSGGASNISDALDLSNPIAKRNGIIFDEIHKFPKWKSFLKGFFDSHGKGMKIAVTGSARMNVYKRGGDSLMGRYFSYRIHPFSARETTTQKVDLDSIFQESINIKKSNIETLLEVGGYPEPFLNGTKRFYNKWKNLRLEQLFTEDLRDLSRVQDIKGIKALADLLALRVASGINYSSLSNELNVTSDTIKAWMTLLESVFYSYSVRPWFKNIANSIRKQPKVYMWDWSIVSDAGAKRENFVASHLHKAVHWWTDNGLGVFDLFYIRDKSQREVDFLVTKDNKPFILVECKSSKKDAMNPNLEFFQKILKVPYAFQLVFDMPQSDIIPTDYDTPIKISILDLFKILL